MNPVFGGGDAAATSGLALHRDQQVRFARLDVVAGAEGDGRAAADGVVGGAEVGLGVLEWGQ